MTRVSKPVICSSGRRAAGRRRRGAAWPNASTSPRACRELLCALLARQRPALADDHDREVLAARVALLDQLGAALDGERELGDQHDVGAAGDAARDRQPAGVAAHDLDDDHAVVRLGRRVQPVDRLGRDRDRGVEAERLVGRREVVVDRLRNADDGQAVLAVEPRCDAERVLAADRDQPVELLERVLHGFDAALLAERVRAAGAQDRAAAREDARDGLEVERAEEAVDHAAPAAQHADRLGAAVDQAPRRRPDDGIQSGAVPSAGEHSHPHPHSSSIAPGSSVGWQLQELGEFVAALAHRGDEVLGGLRQGRVAMPGEADLPRGDAARGVQRDHAADAPVDREPRDQRRADARGDHPLHGAALVAAEDDVRLDAARRAAAPRSRRCCGCRRRAAAGRSRRASARSPAVRAPSPPASAGRSRRARSSTCSNGPSGGTSANVKSRRPRSTRASSSSS